MKNLNVLLTLAFASVLLAACDKEDTPPSNEQELVTRVSLTLTDSAAGTQSVFQFNDPDGDGGVNPTIDTIRLQANRTYFTTIKLYDAISADTAIDLTGEIEEESDAHQWFFDPSGSNLAVRYMESDKDENGIYVGLQSRWYSGSAGRGSIRVTLKHQPGEKPSGPKPNGDETKGETDVEVLYPYRIN